MSLHERLVQKYGFYRRWHINPQATLWNFVILGIVAFALFIVVLISVGNLTTVNNSQYQSAEETSFGTITPENLKIAFMGDQGASKYTPEVLQLIKDEKAEAWINIGDFDYLDSPDLWEKQINDVLGEKFPVIAVVGNHELLKLKQYKQKISDRISRIPNISCEGDLGVKYACSYKGLFVVMTAPNVTDAGHEFFIKEQLAKNNSLWSICAWHKNQKLMQVGNEHKNDETGWGVFEECRKGGAIVVNGHDHVYARTYLMDNFETQTLSPKTDPIVLEKGKSFLAISGLGGKSIVPQQLEASWWASIYTSTQNATFGALFCTFNTNGDPTKASCYFKNVKGQIVDEFDLVSNVERVAPRKNTLSQ